MGILIKINEIIKNQNGYTVSHTRNKPFTSTLSSLRVLTRYKAYIPPLSSVPQCLLNLSAFLNQVDQGCLKIPICRGKSGGVSPVLREGLQTELTTYWTLKNQHTRMIWENTGQRPFSKRLGFISCSHGFVLIRELVQDVVQV